MSNDKLEASNLEDRKILEGQLRECYGRVVYTHKAQEVCADTANSVLGTLKLSQIILSAIASGSFLSTALGDSEAGAIIGAATSTILLALNLYNKSSDLGEIAERHRQAASDIWLIREQYLSLLTDLRLGDASVVSVRQARDTLLDDLHGVYAGAPRTNSRAYQLAQRKLKENEDMTFSDAEIDGFLPTELRRS